MKITELIRILITILVRHGNSDITCLIDGYEFGMEYLKKEKIKIIYFYDRDEDKIKKYSDIGGSLEEIDHYMLSNTKLYPEAKEAKCGLIFHR
jgi:hypothetical protein